jgi:hypothetical protein
MNIVVTGSIAYDYLMSFPGKFTEHFLAEHMKRISLSFLVDTMDKRRGGCAPNIAYTLALLGERPDRRREESPGRRRQKRLLFGPAFRFIFETRKGGQTGSNLFDGNGARTHWKPMVVDSPATCPKNDRTSCS